MCSYLQLRFWVVYTDMDTCIFWYTCTHKPLGECVYQENTSDEWDIPWLYQEKGLYINYFIPCHRKYSGQMGRLGLTQLNCTDWWECSVEYRWIYIVRYSAFCLAVFFMAWYKLRYTIVINSFLLCLGTHISTTWSKVAMNSFIIDSS